jgi:hypothetical protein
MQANHEANAGVLGAYQSLGSMPELKTLAAQAYFGEKNDQPKDSAL